MSCVAITAICQDSVCSDFTCFNSTCLNNCLDYFNFSDYTSPNTFLNAFWNHTCMDRCQTGCFCPNYNFIAFNVVMLLAVVLPVIVVNTALLVALVLESSIAKVVRLVLASILISCLLTALGLVMYHIAEIVLSIPPVNNPIGQSANNTLRPDPLPCTITIFLIVFGGAARLVFMATFAIVVYITVKDGKATKKHIVVAVLVAVVVLWVIAILGTSPWLSQEVIHTEYWTTGYVDSLYCAPAFVLYGYIYEGLFLFFFCVVAPSVAVIFLLIVCCKTHSITSYMSVEKAMVKFGFFLLLGNGLNVLVLIGPVLITSTITFRDIDLESSLKNLESLHEITASLSYAGFTLMNAGLIPTPILILIFFKSIRKRLLYWLCCCCVAKKRKAKRNRKNNNNVEGRMVTTEV